MKDLLPILTVGLLLILLFNTFLLDRTILLPDALGSANTIPSANTTLHQQQTAQGGAQQNSTGTTIANQPLVATTTPSSAIALAGSIIIAMGIVALVLFYPIVRGDPNRPTQIHQLYRLLVAIGVILTVVLIIVYLNSLIFFSALPISVISALLETQKNFITIIGTAFASLVAFYFGSRATQEGNHEGGTGPKGSKGGERTTPGTGESGQKALEVYHINPTDESRVYTGIEGEVKATFSEPVRTASISEETFTVNDEDGNAVEVNPTPADDYKTIILTRYTPSYFPFKIGKKYTVTIKKSIMAISGATMTADKVWSFSVFRT